MDPYLAKLIGRARASAAPRREPPTESERIAAFISSLSSLNKELDTRHAEWRYRWTCEIRAMQAAKDAAVREALKAKGSVA